jgi:hypothetical protein
MWSYRVNLDKRVRSDHALRRINSVLDLGFVRGQVLCGHNDYVIRRAYRRAQPVVDVPRVDQTLHIILCAFRRAPSVC